MFSQRFSRSTAIRRNSFGYRPFRLLATCSSFPCKVCHFRLSQNRGSVHNSAKSASRNRGCAKQANDPTLSSSFVNCDRLSVRIQCDSARSMTQQLLHYLDICFSCPQQRRIRVPERMPSDVLCDSDLHRSGADKTPHDCLSPIRFFAGRSGTRKHPIIWFSVGCVLPPCLQRLC